MLATRRGPSGARARGTLGHFAECGYLHCRNLEGSRSRPARVDAAKYAPRRPAPKNLKAMREGAGAGRGTRPHRLDLWPAPDPIRAGQAVAPYRPGGQHGGADRSHSGRPAAETKPIPARRNKANPDPNAAVRLRASGRVTEPHGGERKAAARVRSARHLGSARPGAPGSLGAGEPRGSSNGSTARGLAAGLRHPSIVGPSLTSLLPPRHGFQAPASPPSGRHESPIRRGRRKRQDPRAGRRPAARRRRRPRSTRRAGPSPRGFRADRSCPFLGPSRHDRHRER